MLDSFFRNRKTAVGLVVAAVIAVTVLIPEPAQAEAGKRKKNSQSTYSPPKPPGTGVEKKDTGQVISADVVEKKVEKLSEKIDWLTSLDEAKSLAQKQHKPIFWIHVLGDLDGEC